MEFLFAGLDEQSRTLQLQIGLGLLFLTGDKNREQLKMLIVK